MDVIEKIKPGLLHTDLLFSAQDLAEFLQRKKAKVVVPPAPVVPGGAVSGDEDASSSVLHKNPPRTSGSTADQDHAELEPEPVLHASAQVEGETGASSEGNHGRPVALTDPDEEVLAPAAGAKEDAPGSSAGNAAAPATEAFSARTTAEPTTPLTDTAPVSDSDVEQKPEQLDARDIAGSSSGVHYAAAAATPQNHASPATPNQPADTDHSPLSDMLSDMADAAASMADFATDAVAKVGGILANATASEEDDEQEALELDGTFVSSGDVPASEDEEHPDPPTAGAESGAPSEEQEVVNVMNSGAQ